MHSHIANQLTSLLHSHLLYRLYNLPPNLQYNPVVSLLSGQANNLQRNLHTNHRVNLLRHLQVYRHVNHSHYPPTSLRVNPPCILLSSPQSIRQCNRLFSLQWYPVVSHTVGHRCSRPYSHWVSQLGSRQETPLCNLVLILHTYHHNNLCPILQGTPLNNRLVSHQASR